MTTRTVNELRPHPENIKIYNDYADSDLIESVRSKGVINPLLITFDNRIINGHRRWDAAQKCGLLSVPVVEFPSHDELDILEALIESNRQRIKTNEQVGREYDALKQVYHERDSKQGQRPKQNGEPPEFVGYYVGKKGAMPEVLPQGSTSENQFSEVKPSAKAAEVLGVSQPTAHKAAEVVKTIDKLSSNGHVREAENLRATLNTNVKKAYQTAQDRGYIAPPPQRAEPKPEPKVANYITLDQWNELGEQEKQTLLTPELSGAKFNDQKSDNIEWALWSWNPVTGCKHNCPYCYARDIAERFYEQKFEPAFIPSRLSAPQNTRVPSEAEDNIGYKNVFTCSMADLFGRWVPTEWIQAVLDSVSAAPQWNFLFLTKFPIRMAEFDFPDNAWVGTTVDCQARVKPAEDAFRRINARVKWLSCEPLLEPLEFSDLGMFQWIVIGGSSKSTQTPEWHPPRAWISRVETKAHEVGCMVYEKTNLFPLIRLREYPGQPPASEIELPAELRYLPSIG